MKKGAAIITSLFSNEWTVSKWIESEKRLGVQIFFIFVDIQTLKKIVKKCYNYADAINAKGKFALTSLWGSTVI